MPVVLNTDAAKSFSGGDAHEARKRHIPSSRNISDADDEV